MRRSEVDESRPSYRSPSPSRGHPRMSERQAAMHGQGRGSPGRMGEEDDLASKRRRLDFDLRAESESHPYSKSGPRSYPEDHYAAGGAAPPPHLPERRSIGEEGPFDSAVPLARRRGDAAQAKASRLHIETGYSPDAHSAGQHRTSDASHADGGPRSDRSLHMSHPSSGHYGAKSAPPYKLSFTERDRMAEGHPLPPPQHQPHHHYSDPRGEGPPLHARPGYGISGGRSSSQYMGPSSTYGNRRDGRPMDEQYDEMDSHHSRPREPVHATVAALAGGPQGSGHGYRGGLQPGVGTPLTSTRNAFVPQTATLPSPAYHTTQFVRQAGGSGAGIGSSSNLNGSSATANGTGANGAGPIPPASATVPPRTAALNPPMTARLPDHLRSPPSSKTQFLSLFSNFYDSLQDSRTLKVTLEDQVRRSNTLLQTLQRSARVLELTVERRLTSERSIWESQIQALEERCRRLERATGAGSPTAPKEDGAAVPANEDKSTADGSSKEAAEGGAREEDGVDKEATASDAATTTEQAQEDATEGEKDAEPMQTSGDEQEAGKRGKKTRGADKDGKKA